jgi:plastocyanin
VRTAIAATCRESTKAVSRGDSPRESCISPERSTTAWPPNSCTPISKETRVRVEGFSKIRATPRPASAREESGAAFNSIARSSSVSSSAALSSAPVRKWGGTVRQFMGPVAIVCAASLLVAGCGSGKSSASGTTGATSSTATSTVKSGLTVPGKINYASPPANAPVQSGVVKIAYREFAIEPDTLKAKVGSTLKWTNENTEKCNVKSEGGSYTFDSGELKAEGGTFELELDKPGTIHYECTAYPTTMNGTIEVVE